VSAARRATVGVGLALAATVTLAYLRPLFAGDTFVLRDHLSYTLPSRAHLVAALRAGQLPEWWDDVGLGVPFAASPMHGVVYPPAWLLVLLPVPFGADFLLVAHLFLLGAGGALLSRRLGADARGATLAGGALLLSGYASSMVVDGIPLPWTPWCACAALHAATVEGRRAQLRAGALLAAAFGIQLLSGDPAGLITSALLAGGVVLVQAPRRLGPLVAALLCSTVLGAALMLPSLAFVRESTRGGGLSSASATIWSMHPMAMLEWIWPRVLGDPTQAGRNLARVVADASAGQPGLDPAWALSTYVGAPILILAVVAATGERRARLLAWLSLGFVLLALGRYTPVYGLYRLVALPERMVRYPEKHFAGATVLWAALAGVGLTRALAAPPRLLRWLLAATVAALGIAVGALALFGPALDGALRARAGSLQPPLDVGAALGEARSGGLAALALLVLVAGALALGRSERLRRWAAPLAIVAVLGHLTLEGWRRQPLVARAAVTTLPAMLQPIVDGQRPDDEPPRLHRPRELAPRVPAESAAEVAAAQVQTGQENSTALFGIAGFPGYEPLHTARFAELWQAAADSGRGARLLRLFGVEYVILPSATVAQARFRPLAEVGGLTLARDEQHRPRAFVTGRFRRLPTDEAIRAALFAPSLQPDGIRLPGAGPDGASASPDRPCEVRRPRPEEADVRCRADGPGFAVLLDAWAPGWSATVDGAPAQIERADAVVRAVALSAGEHQIHFRYRTPWLRGAALVSLLGWLALLLTLFRTRRAASM
jgi:hypothetical protein